MSQLALQGMAVAATVDHSNRDRRSESPSESHLHSSPSQIQDSPTIGRALVSFFDTGEADASDDNDDFNVTTLSPPPQPLSITITGAKSVRKPAPSPLQASTAVSPPSSASPNRSNFPSPVHELFPGSAPQRSPTQSLRLVSSADALFRQPFNNEVRHYKEAPSPPATPISPFTRIPGSHLVPVSPNAARIVSDPQLTTKPVGGSSVGGSSMSAMASSSASGRVDSTSALPRTTSLGSAVSNISSKDSQDPIAGMTDVANLIKTAGTPEAVIQYLLKEKQSQSQQNAQLWRLVDKQRAMILGLNKDLERALKDKEKYRKKMKELMTAHEGLPKIDTQQPAMVIPRVDVNGTKEQTADVPTSPSNIDSDSVKNSPIDMAMAPYPITPPADHIPNGPSSVVGELLDPSHSMPKASEHALGHFDHEEEARAVDQATKAAQDTADARILSFNSGLPPSRSLPSEPPSGPPPKPPVAPKEFASMLDQTISQFPPPSAPPPRKPPPAPLQLRKEVKAAVINPPEDEIDSDSDYDSLLEVDELPIPDKRGRRRTREEDEEEREKLAQLEAGRRSLSKKSKKSSQPGTPKTPELEPPQGPLPASPRSAGSQPVLARENIPVSLAGVLNGGAQPSLGAPLLSPGLPSSPRPLGMKSLTSPPLSPRGMAPPSGPLSPRAPRQPISLPPNTPSTSHSAGDPLALSSPKPLNITKRGPEHGHQSPAGSHESGDRSRIFRGFVTEELPDLLLPPNALPSVDIKVASSRMKPSRASLISLTQLEEDPVFTLAVFSRAEGGELWRVEKDTTSLAKLDQKLKQCSSFTARTPDRALFSGHAPAKLDARRVVLNQYLDELLNTPLDMPTALELCKYLSTNTLPPNADETGSAVDSGVEVGVQKTGPGGRPLKSGYLTKRGKNFGGWKARFFVLDGPLLKYYETPGGAHLGTIKLLKAQIGKQSQHSEGSPAGTPNNDEQDNQYRHAFLVLEPKKKDSSSHVKHVLCAESDHERDQWVETLLRWIDYKESAGDDSNVKTEQDRQVSGVVSHANGMNARKKQNDQATKSHNARSASQDGLIGISYEGTKQGDAPDGAPVRRRNTETPDSQQERSAPPSYTISAPRDPQVISDTASWGAKAALIPPGPTVEEKKQRKRSFFGFGPKTRSSSDDQDSLFSASSQSIQGSEYRGPLRQVFGAPLAEAVRYNGPSDVSVPLPAVVYRCIQYLDAKGAITEEGIFRLSGSNVVIKALRERFNVEGDINLVDDETYYDIHAVASLLKLYLRELPTTILTRDLHLQFLSVIEMPSQSEKVAALGELVQLLPQANGTLLRYLIAFLIKIIRNADTNKMTVRNVGIVFSPTLNIPAPVFALLLQNYDGIFGISPEEYELPTPSESDWKPPPEPQSRRPSSRAGPTASPQRQRLVEQLQHQRSTPTPPPAMMPGAGRSTATPPPATTRQMGYEPPYMAQQPTGSQSSLRPAYESGYMPPPSQASNDRPQYQASYEQDYSDYDQSHTARAKRRESSMFMGNIMSLSQQGSKSRLRE